MTQLSFMRFAGSTPPKRHPLATRVRAVGMTLGLILGTFAPGLARAQVSGAIAVYPTTSTIEVGSSKQFTAYVPISPNTVVWSVNDIAGGSAALGTISSSGFYQAPATAPSNNVVVVKATSTAYPGSVGAATMTITRKYPWLWSVSPSSLVVGNYQVSFNGANFAPDSQALANGVAVQTTYSSSTKIVATGVAAQAGTVVFSVRQPGNGMVVGNTVSAQVTAAPVTVTVAPTSATVQVGNSQLFTVSVSGSTNTGVTWSVNGTVGGSAAAGTITTGGVYTAPASMPASSTVTVRATSVANAASYAQATVTLQPVLPAITITMAPTTATLQLNATKAFAATVTGSTNTAVTWSVNGVGGGSSTYGTINGAGLYTAPASLPAATNVIVRATSVANPTAYAQATVTLTAIQVPPVPMVSLTHARFLEQASFGPSPATLTKVQQMGFNAYLDEQFTLPETVIPAPAGNSMGSLRQWALYNYTSAPDQLRQRVAYALGQIIVTSGSKLVYADEILPWMRALSTHAFGNYRQLLREVSTSPSMGKYLDLANSMKPGLAGGANENYARELMQLFTIGLWQLNQDGTFALDGNGHQVPTYDQQTVREVARTLTGWTYATAPGATPYSANNEYFGAPMETRPANHDTGSKSFLGCVVPANQTVDQDLDAVIDCLMLHSNTAPFVATRLIRSLVTSNPSPGYVQRIANVFVDNGNGIRGDLKAVVRAILLDSEARQDNATVNQGRLKEPILQVAGMLRALNGQFSPTQQLTYVFDSMAQSVLSPPSVFSWFSPLYRVPKSPLFGPEFQIYTPTEATLRGNFMYYLLTSTGGDFSLDLTPFQAYGYDMQSLVEAANQTFLYGRMPTAMKQILITAATPGYDAKARIETVLYLTLLSGQYAVQY